MIVDIPLSAGCGMIDESIIIPCHHKLTTRHRNITYKLQWIKVGYISNLGNLNSCTNISRVDLGAESFEMHEIHQATPFKLAKTNKSEGKEVIARIQVSLDYVSRFPSVTIKKLESEIFSNYSILQKAMKLFFLNELKFQLLNPKGGWDIE